MTNNCVTTVLMHTTKIIIIIKRGNSCVHIIPSFSSKRGHVTVKHVLTVRKHDKLGNQTFEVLQPLKRMVHTIPLTYFTYWSSSRHLNYFISEILGQRNTWFEVSAVFVYRKHRKLSSFGAKVCLTAVELQMFGYQACHVCAQLEHVFFCHVSTLRRKRR